MSSVYVKQNKELSGVKVISSKKAYFHNPKTGERNKLNPDYEFVGKVDMTFPSAIIKANKKNKSTTFIDDVSELPKRAKVELVNYFYDKNGKRNNKTVAYLVRTDNKSKTTPSLRGKTGKSRRG